MVALVGIIALKTLNLFGNNFMAIPIAIIIGLALGAAEEVRPMNSNYPQIDSGLIPILVFFLLAAFFHIVLNNTRYGNYVCAVGSNEEVARYSAINLKLVKFVTYIISGFTDRATSILLSAHLNSISSSNAGLFCELDAIAAVVNQRHLYEWR